MLIVLDEVLHIVDERKLDDFIKNDFLNNWKIINYVFFMFNYFDLDNNSTIWIYFALKTIFFIKKVVFFSYSMVSDFNERNNLKTQINQHKKSK